MPCNVQPDPSRATSRFGHGFTFEGAAAALRADVWMTECGDGARLTLEALARLGVAGEVRGQDLDRHSAIESRVARFVDLAHSARADQFIRNILAPGGVWYRKGNFRKNSVFTHRRGRPRLRLV